MSTPPCHQLASHHVTESGNEQDGSLIHIGGGFDTEGNERCSLCRANPRNIRTADRETIKVSLSLTGLPVSLHHHQLALERLVMAFVGRDSGIQIAAHLHNLGHAVALNKGD
jgi:hypothetical protein